MPQTELLQLSDIYVPAGRQRAQRPDAHIQDLRQSIERDGLIHAILVTSERELVAGFCRLQAIQGMVQPYRYGDAEVPSHLVPALIISGRDDKEIFRLELEENIRRKNLTPVEEAVATKRLHDLFREEHGDEWSRMDTGRALNSLRSEERSDQRSLHEVTEALLIAQFETDEDVGRAGSRREAANIARKKLERMFTSALGAAMPTMGSRDYVLHQGDLHALLPNLQAGIFSCIIADPPYGIGANNFGDQAPDIGHEYDDTPEHAVGIAGAIFAQGYRVAREDAHIYLFCDIRSFFPLCELARSAGWNPYPTPLIWNKVNKGHAPIPGFWLRRYECILFASKGTKVLNTPQPDVLSFPQDEERQHAAQKPVALYRKLLEISALPGDLVFDPCCGRGTIFLAAKEAKVKAVGIEKDQLYAGIAQANIASLR